ncbi:hypothetical protein P5673_023173 [Acropora cervicornis]|uniref:Uncharacterized protein n=1 Tax=Acropora cervicornis TaxID=6130 RepID=A0AAD9UZ32_ACRCE|nr:hypothetical protein P5673_023173 [Acropora cervicornis]
MYLTRLLRTQDSGTYQNGQHRFHTEVRFGKLATLENVLKVCAREFLDIKESSDLSYGQISDTSGKSLQDSGSPKEVWSPISRSQKSVTSGRSNVSLIATHSAKSPNEGVEEVEDLSKEKLLQAGKSIYPNTGDLQDPRGFNMGDDVALKEYLCSVKEQATAKGRSLRKMAMKEVQT